jgi:hypothetical protein
MGSSTSGLYHGTGEKSQPYSPKGYHVDTPMLEHDKITRDLRIATKMAIIKIPLL